MRNDGLLARTYLSFTGTQQGMAPRQYITTRNLLIVFKEFGFRGINLGDCVGADAEAFELAVATGYRLIGHPPTEPKKRAFLKYDEEFPPLPYLERNHRIVDNGSFLIAAPKSSEEYARSGTWATVRYARSKQRHGVLVLPNGNVKRLTD